MSKVFNAKVLANRQPVARKVVEVCCPDYDGELLFKVQEPDGAAIIRAMSKAEGEGAAAATASLIADCVVDEKGRKVFGYEAAADFFIDNLGKVDELVEVIGEFAELDLDDEGADETTRAKQDPTSAA